MQATDWPPDANPEFPLLSAPSECCLDWFAGSQKFWLVAGQYSSRTAETPPIAQEEHHGPAESGVATYRRIIGSWKSLRSQVEVDLFELNQNYFSESPSDALTSPDKIWGTEELLHIFIGGDGDIEMSFIFDWQLPEDGHEITVYFKQWHAVGTSIDG